MRRAIWILGLLNAVILAVHAGLSYLEAGSATFDERPYGQIAFYTELGDVIGDVVVTHGPRSLLLERLNREGKQGGARLAEAAEEETQLRNLRRKIAYAIGGDWLGQRRFVLWNALPLALSTLVAVVALLLVGRWRERLDPSLPVRIRRWGYALAIIMGLAVPVLVPDFWLSFAWGRTMWWGLNPYYEVPPQAVIGLPFDPPMMRMTYGPLWALISWLITKATAGSVFWSAVAFKALLVTAWCAVLRIVGALVEGRSVREQCAALLVVGWLPLGPVQIAGDGHNDVLMLVFIVAWLLLLDRGRPLLATAALALSVCVKYVSAPLFLVDFLFLAASAPAPSWRERIRAYVPRGLLAAAICVAVFAPFFESLGFFRETAAVREGYFFLPADAIKAIGTMLGVNAFLPALAVEAIFPVATLLCLVRFWRAPSRETRLLAVAGIMLSVLFVAAGHVWPWYVLWLAVPAALLPRDHRLARWSAGVAITAPFPLLVWTGYPHASDFLKFQLPSLIAYGFALLWMVWLWRFTSAAGSRSQPAR